MFTYHTDIQTYVRKCRNVYTYVYICKKGGVIICTVRVEKLCQFHPLNMSRSYANISNYMSVIQGYYLHSSGGKVMRVPFEYLKTYLKTYVTLLKPACTYARDMFWRAVIVYVGFFFHEGMEEIIWAMDFATFRQASCSPCGTSFCLFRYLPLRTPPVAKSGRSSPAAPLHSQPGF